MPSCCLRVALQEPIHRGVNQLLPSTLQSAWQKRNYYNSWRKRYNKSYVSGHGACLQLMAAMSGFSSLLLSLIPSDLDAGRSALPSLAVQPGFHGQMEQPPQPALPQGHEWAQASSLSFDDKPLRHAAGRSRRHAWPGACYAHAPASGPRPCSDYTPAELSRMVMKRSNPSHARTHGGGVSVGGAVAAAAAAGARAEPLPDEWNWVTQGKVSEVRDQTLDGVSQCGSCWAFAALGGAVQHVVHPCQHSCLPSLSCHVHVQLVVQCRLCPV